MGKRSVLVGTSEVECAEGGLDAEDGALFDEFRCFSTSRSTLSTTGTGKAGPFDPGFFFCRETFSGSLFGFCRLSGAFSSGESDKSMSTGGLATERLGCCSVGT